MTLADFATPLQVALDICSGSTPYDSIRSQWTGDSKTSTESAVTIQCNEVGKTRNDRGVHTHRYRPAASGNRLVDHQITVHGSNLRLHPLMRAGR